MYWFYNLALRLTSFFLGFIAWFHPKIHRFVSGRKLSFAQLEKAFSNGDRVLWVHTASLGEFEQGLPVIQQLKAHYPDYKVLVTFFSPSGYEVKKDSEVAHCVTYLPLDTQKRVARFLDLARPQLAIFVKYEVWPNYYRELGRRKIPLLMISARFRKGQAYFRWYGGLMRQALRTPSHIFVQDENSLTLLNSLGITQTSVSGDTRFDRVSEILDRDNRLAFMDTFTNGSLCLVGGSTWPEDEALLVPFINQYAGPVKYVLAPHDIKEAHILKLRESIRKKVVLYSRRTEAGLQEAEVLILDTIGLLTRIYSYADLAYVGGGFATGLHNTLEPAVFGIPVLIGPNYRGFSEAVALVERGGLLVASRREDYNSIVEHLLSDPVFRKATGEINASYVRQNRGATTRIMDYIRSLPLS